MLRDKTLLGSIAAVALLMVGIGMVMAQLPQRVIEFDGNGRSVGYLAASFAVSYLLFQIPSGVLADRIGMKPLLLLGYLACSLSGIAYYFAANSSMIFFARLLQGFGEAPIWALAPALLSLRFPLDKGKVIGIYNAALHIGLTFGPILGVILARKVTTNAIFPVFSVCCLFGALVIFLLVENPAGKQAYATNFNIFSVIRLIKGRQTLLTLSGVTIYGAGYGVFITNIPAFLLEEKNFTATHIGLFFSLFYLAISLSQIITGFLSDRLGRRIFMIWGLVFLAVGLIVMPVFEFPLILPILATASFGMGAFCLASMAYLNETVPDSLKGTISGAYYLFWGGGYFLAPLIIAEIAGAINFQAAIISYSSLTMLVTAGIALWLPKH